MFAHKTCAFWTAKWLVVPQANTPADLQVILLA